MSTDANARGARPTLGHLPGLDGVRAFAVLAIIAFHTGLSSVPAGFYGVDAFFVLSGFLITSLLVKEWGESGTIRLRRFWARRARRLLPALFLLVAVIGIVMAVVPRLLTTPHILGDALSTVFYVSNWYSIHGGATYFSLTSQPSPLLHTWSLAIEEQFYLVWPLVVLAVLKVGAGVLRDRRRRLQALFVVACLGSVASAIWMAIQAPHGYTSRAYYGTDCRAQALLVGAAIAIGLVLWRNGTTRTWFARSAGVAGVLGALGTAAIWTTVSESSTFAFRGGFLVASLAAGAVVLACAVAPRSLAVRFLELPPFPQCGRISYGMYLWYWPVVLVVTGQRLHVGVYSLFLARLSITVAIAALSYNLVEIPIRRGVLKNWRSWVAAPVGAATAISAVFISTLVPVGATELQGMPMSLAAASTMKTTASRSALTATAPRPTITAAHPTPSATVPPPATYLSLPLPAVATHPDNPVKVLLVGDSIAGTLGVGLAEYAKAERDKVQIVNEGDPGCSVSMQSQIKALWYTLPPGPPCDVNNDPNSLFTAWKQWVDDYNPDVVLYLARGETFDQQIGNRWQNIEQLPFDNYVTNRYREAVSVLGSKGATIVLMTSPYYDSGTSPSGGPWPEDAPNRVQLDNATIHQVASWASSPTSGVSGRGKVYVFDLNEVVDPNGKYDASIGNVNVRCGDGVHFSPSGGIYVGLRLLPDVLALGQSHAASSPGGAWPGTLPPSVPSWFPSLPCQ